MANVTTPINNLGIWTVGQLSPNWELPLSRVDANGTFSRIMDLTGVTTGQLSLIIYTSARAVASNSPGAGTFTITQVKPGIVTYAQASADVATSGVYYLKVKINFNGTTPDYSDYISITITA